MPRKKSPVTGDRSPDPPTSSTEPPQAHRNELVSTGNFDNLNTHHAAQRNIFLFFQRYMYRFERITIRVSVFFSIFRALCYVSYFAICSYYLLE